MLARGNERVDAHICHLGLVFTSQTRSLWCVSCGLGRAVYHLRASFHRVTAAQRAPMGLPPLPALVIRLLWKF